MLLLLLCTCSGNAIDVSGARALASALSVNSSLSSLILSDNYISVEGARALAEALTHNTALTELAIKGNELGDEGVEALCTALQVGGRRGRSNSKYNSLSKTWTLVAHLCLSLFSDTH